MVARDYNREAMARADRVGDWSLTAYLYRAMARLDRGSGNCIGALEWLRRAALASQERDISPTRFHNSVHNAAAGYWCIASGCHAPYTTVSVFGYSYAAGLLETIMQVGSDGGSALYVAYDIESCGPLAPYAVSRGLLGVGLVIASERSARTVARLSWSFRSGGSEGLTQAKPANASLLEGNAMAPCLPLFEALARGAGPVTLALGPRMLLDIVVQDARTLPP